MSTVRIRYRTYEFPGMDLHVRTLRDRQQYSDDDAIAEGFGISPASWSLFGVVWDSSEVLAHLMLDVGIIDKRILEVGCGIALASIVLNRREADITSTDHHLEAGNFLLENTRLNKDRAIPFVRTGWAENSAALGRFDLIIGSDLLYEPDNPGLLSTFIEQHSKPICEVILIDPGRRYQTKFSEKMIALGYQHTRSRPDYTGNLDAPYRGWVHRYLRCRPTSP